MLIGIIIGIIVASLVWCIIILKLNDFWSDESLRSILEEIDKWAGICKELNASWGKYCERLIDKFYTDKDAE
jgi:hypothetical protein